MQAGCLVDMDSVMFLLALAFVGYGQLTYGASLSNTEVKPLASFNPVHLPATNTPPSYVYKCGGPLPIITDYDCQTTLNETVHRACYYNGFDNFFSCPQLCEGATRKEKRGMKCRAFCGAYLDDHCLLEPLLPATVTVSRPINTISPPTLQPAYNVSRIPVTGSTTPVSKKDGDISAGLGLPIGLGGGIIFLVTVIVVVTVVIRPTHRTGRPEPSVGCDVGSERVEIHTGLSDGEVSPRRPPPTSVTDENDLMFPIPVQDDFNPDDFNGEGNTQPRVHKSGVV